MPYSQLADHREDDDAGDVMAIKACGTSSTLYMYRRVPRRYEAVEPRKFVWVSLHTDSQSIAASKANMC